MTQQTNLNVLFIVQAGKNFGIGHLKRSLQIAKFYTKPFIFIISDLKDSQPLYELVSAYPHHISSVKENFSIRDILTEHKFDLIICDCAMVKSQMLSILNNCHIPMITLDNSHLGECSEIYLAPLPSKNKKQANFSEIYHSPIDERYFLPIAEHTPINKILISLGGSDPQQNTVKIVKALKEQHYKITVIQGPLSSFSIEECEQVTVKTDVQDLFPYIQENDLIFCGPGSTLLESLAAKKHVIAVAHNYTQYMDLSSIPNVQRLFLFLTTKNIKNAIARSISGKLNLPENFNYKDWFLKLSNNIADRPAHCPLCGSYNKNSFIRTNTQNQYVCSTCNSNYIYNLEAQDTDNDEMIADNSEQEQFSYKQAVLNLREDSNRRVQIIKKILPIPQHHTPYKLMDIGAEHGIFVQEALHNGFSAQGVELSVFARKIALDNHNINIIDSMEKVYENGSVNHVVTIWKKLELLETPIVYLKKVSGLIPIGGMLTFRLPVVKSNTPISKGYFRVTERGGELLAERIGFSIVHIAKYSNEHNEEFLEFYGIKRYDA